MAWTAPKTWATDEVITASGTGSLNEQIRDNMNVVSTHAHSGSAGDGSATLTGVAVSGVDSITFDDEAGDPSVNGTLQRNGANLKYFDGSSAIDTTSSDQAAGTASLRTLGTGATQAAAGNHTHPISAAETASTTQTFSGDGTWATSSVTEISINGGTPRTYTASSTNSVLTFSAMFSSYNSSTLVNNSIDVTVRFKYNGSTVKTVTAYTTGLANYQYGETVVSFSVVPPSTSAVSYDWTMQPSNSSTVSAATVGRLNSSIVESAISV